jgi:hypothetical protein
VLAVLIGCFFKNCPLQATYLIELLSDANGVLVLLKFISDKFVNQERPARGPFKAGTVGLLAARAVEMSLHMLELVCLNYPDRIEEYLFGYNTYLMLGKLPACFSDRPQVERMSHHLIRAQFPYFN